MPLQKNDNATGKILKQAFVSFSVYLHPDVKGPTITIKGSFAQGFSLGDA